MSGARVTLTVLLASPATSVIAIHGEVTALAEVALLDAYAHADRPTTRTVILDCAELRRLDSAGIGLLVALLVRMRRRQQTLLACGLSEHDERLFAATRLDQVIPVFESIEAALAMTDAPDAPG